MIDRRRFLLAAAAALPTACSAPLAAPYQGAPAARSDAAAPFEAIRVTLGPGGRLGVAAIDTGSGRRLLHDAESRYALASTFKLPLAAFVLAELEAGRLGLDEELPFAREDPLDNSAVVSANIGRGRLPVRELASAIIRVSDNSAANALLRRLGGPEGLTRFIRASGDPMTRLDRMEMALGENVPGDPRDTTTPAAMAGLTRTLVLGDRSSPPSRATLADWLVSTVTGPDRLRAGIPSNWRFGHKTGTAARGGANDVGIAWPPDRAPIVIASYLDGGDADLRVRAAAHAAVARLVAETLGGA